jgi:signal peptidase I
MTSESMAPTFRGTSYSSGDRLLVEKVSGWFHPPQRWRVYFFYDAEGTPVTKRIVGLPGEKVSLKDNRIYINGKEVQRPKELESMVYYGYGNLAGSREVDCCNGYFYVGDDSRDSFDSRFLGPIARDHFRGRVCAIVWPPSRIRVIS